MAEEETHEKEKSIAEASEEQEVKECGKRYKVRKIQRKDMVCLPRCEWKHANNSFLVHGYYNYHHLILTVCDGQLKLGVYFHCVLYLSRVSPNCLSYMPNVQNY